MEGLFRKLCDHFVDCKLISTHCADRAEESYHKFISCADIKKKCEHFDASNDRLDDFFIPLLSTHAELRDLVKIVLTISHGNARVESGFSINEDTLKDNMKERTLVAYRIVYDVINQGCIDNVVVSKEMIKEVDSAHKRYIQYLEENRVKQTAGEKRKLERRMLTAELSKAKVANDILDTDMQEKQYEADAKIFQLEKELRKK